MQLLAYNSRWLVACFSIYGFVTNELVKNNQEAHRKSYSKELFMVHMVEICGPAIEDRRFPKGRSTVFFVSGHTYLSSSKNFNIVCSCKAIY